MLAQESVAPLGRVVAHQPDHRARVGRAAAARRSVRMTPPWPRGGYAALTALTVLTAAGLAVLQWDAARDDGPARCSAARWRSIR